MPPRKNTTPKMKAYASFADWKKDQSAKNQKLIGAMQRLIKKQAPGFDTIVKWGQGCWVSGTSPRIFIHTEIDHIQFGFYAGSSMKDPLKLLTGKGQYVRHVKIRTAKDIDTKAFASLIEQVLD